MQAAHLKQWHQLLAVLQIKNADLHIRVLINVFVSLFHAKGKR